MFYLRYTLSELRRRRGRTLLTALGLAVGVGLVATVTALSNGLDDAQQKVLKPLTGVGTDMSVARPLKVSGARFGPGLGLSAQDRQALQNENGGARFGFRNLKPGSTFNRTDFISTSQLSFPESEVAKVAAIDGVKDAAPALTLSAIQAKGKVPENTGGGGVATSGGPAPAPGGAQGPRAINVEPQTVTGVDLSKPSLALVTPSQIRSGHWFRSNREAVLSESYARRKGYRVGDTIALGSKKFTVVGLSKPPLGGQQSDIYIELGQLQKLSHREGRVNQIQVRATSSNEVDAIASEIESTISGAQVTTSKDLAKRIGGSLADARNLSSKLGTALAIVGLVAAFLIASLLTLSSVNKRTRELGTLKALGWRQWLVVRQVSGESLAQGFLGGALGALLGIAGAALVTALGAELKATVAGQPQAGPFGQGSLIASGSSVVKLDAPVDAGLILLAVGLAIAGGLIAGAVGGLRAARLRPADALRNIE
jgi:ABC-type antimicrobial peptide transport system permease subunit